MSNIIEFKKYASNYPEKECTCKKEHIEYVEELDTEKVLKEGDKYWRCNCGGVLFFLTPIGARCKKCGLITNDWVEE